MSHHLSLVEGIASATPVVESSHSTVRQVVEGQLLRTQAEYETRVGEVFQEPKFAWQDATRCVDFDPELFFPKKGGSTKLAKLICSECVVRVYCLNDALQRDERHGVQGGMSERERRALKRMAAS